MIQPEGRLHGALGLTLLASALVAACGGETQPSPPGVFAEPSGVLCTQRDANSICAEPTSSGATTEQLLATQQNTTGNQVRFNALGVQGDS